ncbi:MAG: cytochrome c [Chlorobi bacterium]|nr:cytochrome c [Chlorobiota bacterium]
MKYSTLFIASTFFIFTFISCDKTRNDTARHFMPDMQDSRAYETYSANPNFSDDKTARPPVEGTIPRGFIPYQYPNTPEGKIAAGNELKNPVLLNKESLKDGEKMYKRFCIDCHGEKGDGKGYLFTSGKYPVQPRTLIDNDLKTRPVGQIYHVITLGSAVMGAHGSQIAPNDRWKIIHYIKEVLQKN